MSTGPPSKKSGLRWPRSGLMRRFFLYMFFLVVIIMGGVFIVVEKNNRQTILLEGKKRAISNTKYLAALSTAPLLMYDYIKLEQNVDEVSQESDVIYAIIFDRNGNIAAHSSRDDLIGKKLHDPLSTAALTSETQLIQSYRDPQTGIEMWDIAYPIFIDRNQRWGTVRIGFSKKSLMQEIKRNRSNLIIISLASLLLAGIASSLLAVRISGPIRELSEGALSISRGNLNQKLIIRTGDEIEELSKIFNRMTQDLAKNRDQQRRLIEQLSQKNVLLKREIEAREQLESELIKIERLRALGEMSGGVAHDFNNILGAILGRAQLLLEKVDTPSIKRGIEIIEKAALDGAETVRRIQEFTRVRADSSSFRATNINQVIRDAIEFTRTRWKNEAEAMGRPVSVTSSFNDIPPVIGDPSGLREVFTNLIINAVDAMPEGGSIHIRTEIHGESIIITFSDTGKGMSLETKQRIFEPFFTTKGTRGSGLGLSICYGIITRHKGEITIDSIETRGSGLGLSICYGIITRHKGEITIDSIEGEGSTFIITLPFVRATEEKREPSKAANLVTPAEALVIDDEKVMCNLLSDILKNSGCSVDTAEKGIDGLRLFSAKTYDIVFSDLGMKDISGWEVARHIKDRSPDTPFVLVTGWGKQLSDEDIRKKGVDFVLSKPFKIQAIRDIVNRAMAEKKK